MRPNDACTAIELRTRLVDAKKRLSVLKLRDVSTQQGKKENIVGRRGIIR